MTTSLRENKQSANRKQTRYSERDDVISPAWRRFWNGHCWPASQLDLASLDELQRLAKAVPYLQAAIEDAIARKLEAAR